MKNLSKKKKVAVPNETTFYRFKCNKCRHQWSPDPMENDCGVPFGDCPVCGNYLEKNLISVTSILNKTEEKLFFGDIENFIQRLATNDPRPGHCWNCDKHYSETDHPCIMSYFVEPYFDTLEIECDHKIPRGIPLCFHCSIPYLESYNKVLYIRKLKQKLLTIKEKKNE